MGFKYCKGCNTKINSIFNLKTRLKSGKYKKYCEKCNIHYVQTMKSRFIGIGIALLGIFLISTPTVKAFGVNQNILLTIVVIVYLVLNSMIAEYHEIENDE